MARKRRRPPSPAVLNRDCAGTGIGRDKRRVSVDPENFDEPVRAFDTFTRDPEAMAARLSSCGAVSVAMASTLARRVPASLEGRRREEQLFAPKQSLQSFDFFFERLKRCEAWISARFEALSLPGDGGGSPTAPTERRPPARLPAASQPPATCTE